MLPPWTAEELDADRARAIEIFRTRRQEEPIAAYLAQFRDSRDAVRGVLSKTIDLRDRARLVDAVSSPDFLEALRYFAGPPVSEDDLKTLAGAVLAATRLSRDAKMAGRVTDVIMSRLDRERFPWIGRKRAPTDEERRAAVLASATLLATRRLETTRRHNEKVRQESHVMTALEQAGLERVVPRTIRVLTDAPARGQFCGESRLGVRKADIVVGLPDGRVLPVECKVSNSAINSVKRLNNDAVVKALAWRTEFGHSQVVPSAVLSGVYKLHNLVDAQERGLSLFWAHDLTRLVEWIRETAE